MTSEACPLARTVSESRENLLQARLRPQAGQRFSSRAEHAPGVGTRWGPSWLCVLTAQQTRVASSSAQQATNRRLPRLDSWTRASDQPRRLQSPQPPRLQTSLVNHDRGGTALTPVSFRHLQSPAKQLGGKEGSGLHPQSPPDTNPMTMRLENRSTHLAKFT
jgi:hypothetical protein